MSDVDGEIEGVAEPSGKSISSSWNALNLRGLDHGSRQGFDLQES